MLEKLSIVIPVYNEEKTSRKSLKENKRFNFHFTNINLTDIETCYKVFRGEIIRSIWIEEDDSVSSRR